MKKNILFVCILSLILGSCSDSEFYYDTAQKHTIYFNKGRTSVDVNTFSFAYYNFDEKTIEIPVKYMGMPSDKEQSFKVTVVADTVGVMPVEGTDYEIENASFAPGEVETNLLVKLKRSEVLKDTVYGLSLKFEENELFTPKFDTFYKLTVEDGELPIPHWWARAPKIRNRFLGNYHPKKLRMFLEIFKELETVYPDFYRESVELLGEFLHEVKADDPGMIKDFYYKDNCYIWGKYVFEPVWKHFTDPANIIPGDDISLMEDPVNLYK